MIHVYGTSNTRARLARTDLSPHPRLDAWLARCTSRPALASAARK